VTSKNNGLTTRLAVREGALGPDAFDPSIEGVEVITRSGTDVPSGKVEEVKEQARKSGISLREVRGGEA
jgi:hypothetical protein